MPTKPLGNRTLEERLRQAREEMAQRLRGGESCIAEDFFGADAELCANTEAALELIFTEFTVRDELGQHPSRDDYYRRFPSWHERLQRLFDIHQMVGPQSLSTLNRWSSTGAGQVAAILSGQRVGGYELLEEIGRGGMGVVYRARQVGLNRLVAVKMILAGAFAGPEQRERFRKEAEAAARLDHPGIVRIHEVGEHNWLPYLSMELVEGGSLDQMLADRNRQGTALLPANESAHLVETLARAVHYAHQKGVIHRDLKPANILIADLPIADSKDRLQSEHLCSAIKITDFSLAKTLDAEGEATRTGALVGTPVYMAPEQAAGVKGVFSPAIDVHALGVILYELLTGRPPFEGASVEETLELVRHAEPVPPRQLRSRLPRDLETICLKCLRKEPQRRYPSAEALADDLRRFQEGRPILARPASTAERAIRWVSRHPGVAGLVAALFLLTTAGMGVITSLWRAAEAARQGEKKGREEAERNAAEMIVALARSHWSMNELNLARELLEKCPEPYRGKNWQEVHRLCHLELRQLPLTNTVHWAQWAPDNRHVVASCTMARTIQVWDAETGVMLREFPCRPVHELPAGNFVLSPDGNTLHLTWPERDAGGKVVNHCLVAFDVSTGRETSRLVLPQHGNEWALSPDCTRMASYHTLPRQGRLAIVDVATGEAAHLTDESPARSQMRLKFSPDGRRLAAWGWRAPEGFIDIWDVGTRTKLTTLRLGQRLGFGTTFSFSPDGKLLAYEAGHEQKVLHHAIFVWDVEASREILVLPNHHSALMGGVISPDGRSLAWVEPTGREMHLTDISTGRRLLTLRGHTNPIIGKAFSPDGRRLASWSNDMTIRVWDVRPLP